MEVKEIKYKKTEVGEIPEDWGLGKISSIGEVRGRVGWKGYTKKDLKDFGSYAIEAKHISKENRLDLSQPTHLSKEKFFESPETMVEENDILIVQRGTIGKLVHIDKKIGEATINPSIVILRTKKNISNKFLFLFLTSKEGQKQIHSDTSSTGVPMITQKQIENFTIPLPPTLKEQQAIATALSNMDVLLQSLDQLIAKKRAIKQGTMQQLFAPPQEGGKRLEGFNGEWEERKILNIAPLQRGFDLTNSELKKGKYPVVYSNGIVNFHNEYKVKAPGIVTGHSGTIGNVHFIENDFWPHNTSLWVTRFFENSPKYIFYLFKFIKLNQFGTGSGVPTLNRNDVHDFKIAIPKKIEQTAIAQILTDMDTYGYVFTELAKGEG